MRPKFNENLEGKCYKAIPDEIGKYKKYPTMFYYRIMDKRERTQYRPSKGVYSEEGRLYINITNTEIDFNVGDKVVLFNGDEMIVETIGCIYSPDYMLGMGKFRAEYLEKVLPKALTLKN